MFQRELIECRQLLFGRFPAESQTVQPRATPVHKGFRYRAWMDAYEARTGKRCTYTRAANHFKVHRTTVMRNLKKVGLQ